MPISSGRFCCSCSEDEASSDRRMDHFVGHLSPHQVVESLPCTMARYQIVGIDLLESRNDLLNVLVGQRWHDVKAADDRMYFLDAGGRLRLFDCIDDATVTAGG